MPDTPTTRLGLYKSAANGSELVNYTQDLGNNWDKVDTATGFQIVTSGTRPAAPYPGKPIAESDTAYRTYFSNGTAPASASWVEIPNSSGTFGSTLKLASAAQLTIGADVNIYRGAANQLKTDDSLVVAGDLTVSGIGQLQFVRKTADETVTSSNAYQNDDHLVLPVVANAIYRVEGYIVYQTVSAAGINMRMTGPAGTGLWTFSAVSVSSGTTDTGSVRTATGANGTGSAYLGGAGANMTAILRGTFLPTASGNLQFEWSQNAANATGTIVRANSWLELYRVA